MRPLHQTRTDVTVLEALDDAERVAADIAHLAECGALLVPADELHFLARRLQQLTQGLRHYVDELHSTGEVAR